MRDEMKRKPFQRLMMKVNFLSGLLARSLGSTDIVIQYNTKDPKEKAKGCVAMIMVDPPPG